jgi:hypothetical protein
MWGGGGGGSKTQKNLKCHVLDSCASISHLEVFNNLVWVVTQWAHVRNTPTTLQQ